MGFHLCSHALHQMHGYMLMFGGSIAYPTGTDIQGGYTASTGHLQRVDRQEALRCVEHEGDVAWRLTFHLHSKYKCVSCG